MLSSPLIFVLTAQSRYLKKNKVAACSARDAGSILGSGRYPGEGNVNPLQYSCLGNPMDRRAWWATVHGVTKSQIWQMTEHAQNIENWNQGKRKPFPLEKRTWAIGRRQAAGVGCHFLLQGTFLIQGWNPSLLCLLHCKWILYSRCHLGSPLALLIRSGPIGRPLKVLL